MLYVTTRRRCWAWCVLNDVQTGSINASIATLVYQCTYIFRVLAEALQIKSATLLTNSHGFVIRRSRLSGRVGECGTASATLPSLVQNSGLFVVRSFISKARPRGVTRDDLYRPPLTSQGRVAHLSEDITPILPSFIHIPLVHSNSYSLMQRPLSNFVWSSRSPATAYYLPSGTAGKCSVAGINERVAGTCLQASHAKLGSVDRYGAPLLILGCCPVF